MMGSECSAEISSGEERYSRTVGSRAPDSEVTGLAPLTFPHLPLPVQSSDATYCRLI